MSILNSFLQIFGVFLAFVSPYLIKKVQLTLLIKNSCSF